MALGKGRPGIEEGQRTQTKRVNGEHGSRPNGQQGWACKAEPAADEGPDMTLRGYKQPKTRISYGKPTGRGLGGTSEDTQDFWA